MNQKYAIVGITDERESCDCCGKTGLKRTAVMRDLETGEFLFFGTTCAARAQGWGGTLAVRTRLVEAAAAAAQAAEEAAAVAAVLPALVAQAVPEPQALETDALGRGWYGDPGTGVKVAAWHAWDAERRACYQEAWRHHVASAATLAAHPTWEYFRRARVVREVCRCWAAAAGTRS